MSRDTGAGNELSRRRCSRWALVRQGYLEDVGIRGETWDGSLQPPARPSGACPGVPSPPSLSPFR
jgi:hypothetical protein